MRILSVETSCDETAIAIVRASGGLNRPEFKILASVVSSQIIHKKFGGVVPFLAKREHEKNLVLILESALKKADLLKIAKFKLSSSKLFSTAQLQILDSIFSREPELKKNLLKFLKKYEFPKFDCLAITIGPGLEPALWAGINFVRAFSFLFDIPLVPADHLKGHIYANWLDKKFIKNPFPNLALLISGGHTQLILAKNHNDFKVIGETRDDAVGEAYDKVAKMLKLSFPGGPLIEALAKSGDSKAYNFPRPMLNQKNYDFSFSGLKTAVLYQLQKINKINSRVKANIAASFQQAVVETLVFKTIKASQQYFGGIKNIIAGGGSIANENIRKELSRRVKKEFPQIKIYFPPKELATDNALMIAIAGYFNYLNEIVIHWQKAKALPNLRVEDKVDWLQ